MDFFLLVKPAARAQHHPSVLKALFISVYAMFLSCCYHNCVNWNNSFLSEVISVFVCVCVCSAGDETLEDRAKQKMERLKKRALSSTMMDELRRDHMDEPEEIVVSVYWWSWNERTASVSIQLSLCPPVHPSL